MDVNRILAHPEYNLRSRTKLAVRDDHYARVWLDGLDPIYEVYWRIRNRRLIPRKEFYETAFVCDLAKDIIPHYSELVEMAAGHGLLGLFALLLHPGLKRVDHVDLAQPLSYERILEQLAPFYPFLKCRSHYLNQPIETLKPLRPGALVMGVHCCGGLTDRVVELARASQCDFLVVPCCESHLQLPGPMRRKLGGRTVATVLNEMRRDRWTVWGYDIEERALPSAVTEKRRVFVGRWRGVARTSQPRPE